MERTDGWMTEKERMLAGELYLAGTAQLVNERRRARQLQRLYNETTEQQLDRRSEILRELLGGMGENVYIEPPFRCDYGGQIFVGNNFYANFDCIILDICKITIGDHVQFGPRVSIFAATHPVDAGIRDEGLELGAPVTIGDSVWIGGHTVINPGVSIGERTVIGAGSVVTKDIPSDVVAVGNPCRVLRPITDTDRTYWSEQKAKR